MWPYIVSATDSNQKCNNETLPYFVSSQAPVGEAPDSKTENMMILPVEVTDGCGAVADLMVLLENPFPVLFHPTQPPQESMLELNRDLRGENPQPNSANGGTYYSDYSVTVVSVIFIIS
jgi:hypothetical protein